ncbi:Apoptosis-inducing factor 2 [Pleurostoma richardsiae]|uniref:Apoptosis-inducing factor 2 n=1 Tax=Pleurostoma richardsiae TaxID=41990 RepID=A0AA38S4C5_9PEZI|nr:Apoptosis-inducing factor 2 [Pleurostoma richardsiae]
MGSLATDRLHNDAEAPFKVVVIGGSYAGLSAALNLLDLCEGRNARCSRGAECSFKEPINVDITIVDERDGFYHLIGSPLALALESYAEKAWVKFDDVAALQVPNIHVVQGSVTKVDCAAKTATVKESARDEPLQLDYDYLVTASGLRRVWPVVPQSLKRKQYLFEAGDHIHSVSTADKGVVVVGGGAVGIEMAAELKLVQPQTKVFLAHSRDKLLSAEPLPDECKDKALELLREAGVEVLLEHRLQETREVKGDDGKTRTEIVFTNGHTMLANNVIMAVSRSVPTTTFLPAEALDSEGYVKIQPSLQLPVSTPNSSSHFAVGDLISWSGIKRCGAAMHEGYLAAVNAHKLMQQRLYGTEPAFQELKPIPPMIGLAVGKDALSYGPGEGVQSGARVAEIFFGDDLGFSICWNYLQLGISSNGSK